MATAKLCSERPEAIMASSRQIPRLLISGTSSGVGKTTMMVGLIVALRARGLRVAVFKCGPDYLDPTYHRRAAASTCHNLDGWMMGREAVLRTFDRASDGADIALIEGVMGLFDGASATTEEGSAAQIAKWLQSPVLLVVDAQGMARTVAAIAQGFREFDREVDLRGLLCNRVGSRGHLEILQQAGATPGVLGGLPVEPRYRFPERHLGLQTADPQSLPDDLLQAWGHLVEEWVDVPSILEIARSAPPLEQRPQEIFADSSRRRPGPRIGIAFDEAFHFYYEDNLARLEASGAELIRFSPTHDGEVPEVDGIYLGGGYPEVMAKELASNAGMIDSIRDFAGRGGPIYAECGGLMYLSTAIHTPDGSRHPMVGLIEGEVIVRDKLQALGYVEVETVGSTILGPAGLLFRGHQFRYSEFLDPPSGERLYSLRRRRGGSIETEGHASRNVLASYVHAHWASNPAVAEGFVRACRTFQESRNGKPVEDSIRDSRSQNGR
jgi:cobyrinic acid a,c-diamide synthase